MTATRRALALAAAVLCVVSAVLAACGDQPGQPVDGRRYASDGASIPPAKPPAKPPSVFLLCLDTVRADALAPWGGPDAPMPETSKRLSKGVTFTNAAATATWTAPSVASLLTGLLPSRHGFRDLSPDVRLPDAVPTLAEILGKHGFGAAAYAGGAWVATEDGMLQGFDPARIPFSFGNAGLDLSRRIPGALVSGPKFVFVHTYEAHDPYDAPPAAPGAVRPTPPTLDEKALDADLSLAGDRALARYFLLDHTARPYLFESAKGLARVPRVMRYFERGFSEDPEGKAFAAEAKAAYVRGLAKLDVALAAFLDACEANGVFSNAVVVLCSDHGESFGENGALQHGRSLHDVLLKVPLWIRAPGLPEGKTIDEPVSLVDVLPTVLDLVGLPVPSDSDGISLVPIVRGSAKGHPQVALERRAKAETGLEVDEDLLCVRDSRWKWVLTTDRRTGASRESLFDLSSDPSESRPLPATDHPDWSPAFRSAVTRARPAK